MDKENSYRVFSTLELMFATIFIYYDLFLPTLLILALVAISLILRKEKLQSLGFRKQEKFGRMLFEVILLSIVWTAIDFGLFLPILNHLTGKTQDLSSFKDLKGNVGQLAYFLAASWTLAALGEEIVYRGFIQTRLVAVIKSSKYQVPTAALLTALLFGLAHTEQGVIGVAITTVDALFFSFLRYRYNNLWAAVLAHGFLNTIGVVTFFFTGPIYGLW